MVRKCFGNEPLKDLTMERKRVEKFEESLIDVNIATLQEILLMSILQNKFLLIVINYYYFLNIILERKNYIYNNE